MWDNPSAATAILTAGYAGIWIWTREEARLSRWIFGGLLFTVVCVLLFFSPDFQNVVLGKDVAAIVFGFGLFFLWLTRLAAHGGRDGFVFRPTPLNAPVLIFFLAGVLSAYLAPRWSWYYSLEEITRTGAMVVFFFMVVSFFNTRGRWMAGIHTLLGCTVLTCVYALLQISGYDFVEWGRIVNVSTFGNKDFFASFLTYVFPIALFMAIGSAHFFDAAVYGSIAALALVNIVEGETRGAWVALIALAGAAGWFELKLGRVRSWILGAKARFRPASETWAPPTLGAPEARFRLAAAGTVVLILIGIMTFTPEHKKDTFRSIFQAHSGTNIIRVYIWWGSLRMWWDDPLFGQGIGTYQLTYPFFRPDRYHRIGMSHNTRHAHSEELEILAEQGMLGLSAWSAMILIFFHLCGRRLFQSGDQRERYLFFGVVSGVFAGLIHDSINVNLRWMSSAITFWFLLALGTRYLIGFDPSPPGRPARRAGDVVSRVGRDRIGKGEWILGAASAGVFAFLIWINILVLRGNFILRIVEGTVENPLTQRIGIEKGQEVMRLVPYEHSAYYKTAYAYLMQNQLDKALAAYRTLFSLAPNYAQSHQNIALMAYRQFTTGQEMKYLYQSILEFEWTTLLENSSENHLKLIGLYSRHMADGHARGLHHSHFLHWNNREDYFFALFRLWDTIFRTGSLQPGRKEAEVARLSRPFQDFEREYWAYRLDAARKLGLAPQEIQYVTRRMERSAIDRGEKAQP